MRLTRVATDSLHYDFSKRHVKRMRRLVVFWIVLSIWNLGWVLENLYTDGSGVYLMFYVALLVISLLGMVGSITSIQSAVQDDRELHATERLVAAMERQYKAERDGDA